jgi:NAD(P)-dependent dehydrogenase (short-subunit alcohol dehydrogenase family)
MKLAGRTALITGAGSGIGRAVAVSLAKRGCNLALADIDAVGLAETARLLGAEVTVTQHRLDVADKAAVAAFPAVIEAAHGGLDVLVNNAGVALGGFFEQLSEADFEWLFEINFWGVVRMTRAFLPLLHASPQARLVNLSSLFGLIAPAGQTAYAASKFAVRGFSVALGQELKASNIGVTVVHPGGVATQIANNVRSAAGIAPDEVQKGREQANKLLRLPAAVAGEMIVEGIAAQRQRVIVGSDAKLIGMLERVLPVSYWRVLEQLSKTLTKR